MASPRRCLAEALPAQPQNALLLRAGELRRRLHGPPICARRTCPCLRARRSGTPVAAGWPRNFVSPRVRCFAPESAAGIGVSTDEATSPSAGDAVGSAFHVAVLVSLVSSCSDSLIVVAAIVPCMTGDPLPLRASADAVEFPELIDGSVVRSGTKLLLLVVPPSDVATGAVFSSPVTNPCPK